MKGSQKPKKLQKKAAQKTLKERRVEKQSVAAEQDAPIVRGRDGSALMMRAPPADGGAR